MTVTNAPRTGGVKDSQFRAADGGGRSAMDVLAYLLAPLAGVAIGLAVEVALTNDNVLDSLWTGGSIDPDSIPSGLAIKGAGVAVGIALWLVSAAVMRGGKRLGDALKPAAFGMLPFLSILALNALNGVAGADIVQWSPLALMFSIAFMVAWTAVRAITNGSRLAISVSGLIRRRPVLIVICAGLAYFAVSATLSLLQYRAAMITYNDTADFDEMLWRTLHGRFLMCGQFEHCFLGQHIEFVQLFLLPIYMLWPGLPVLMVLMSLALGSGVIPVYKLAMDRLGSPVAAALFSTAYVFYAPMQYLDKQIMSNTFLPEVFYVPLMLWAVYFLIKERMGMLVLMSFLIVSCKEDLALPVAMFGIVLAARGRWKWGAGLFVSGMAWFLLSMTVAIPYFEGAPSHVLNGTYYAEMGGSMGEILRNVFFHPVNTAAYMLSFKHIDFLLMMLAPFACLALFSPTALVIFLPSLASALLATFPPASTIYFHYHLSAAPLAIVGGIMGAANLARWLPRAEALWRGIERQSRPALVAGFCGVLVLASSATFDVAYGKFPWSLKFYNPNSYGYWRHIYVQKPSAKLIFEKVLPLVPQDARVTATQCIATFLTHRAACFEYPLKLDESDYAVVQEFEPLDVGMSFILIRQIDDDPQLPGFERIFAERGIYVFKRTASPADATASAETRLP